MPRVVCAEPQLFSFSCKLLIRYNARCAGLRKIEQAVLKRQSAKAPKSIGEDGPEVTAIVITGSPNAFLPNRIRLALWCLTIARLYVEFSITTSEALSSLPAC